MKWDHGWVECSDGLLKRAPPTDKGYYSCMLAQQLVTKWTLNSTRQPSGVSTHPLLRAKPHTSLFFAERQPYVVVSLVRATAQHHVVLILIHLGLS